MIKQEGLYQNKVKSSLGSIHNCKMAYLRRHIKDKNNITKFSYVLVNLIFQLSLASGKPRIELKKVNRSINTGKVSLYCNLIFFLKITSQS